MRSFATGRPHRTKLAADLRRCRFFALTSAERLCGRLRIKPSPIRALRSSGADSRKRQHLEISPRARASRYRSITADGIRPGPETTMSCGTPSDLHVRCCSFSMVASLRQGLQEPREDAPVWESHRLLGRGRDDGGGECLERIGQSCVVGGIDPGHDAVDQSASRLHQVVDEPLAVRSEAGSTLRPSSLSCLKTCHLVLGARALRQPIVPPGRPCGHVGRTPAGRRSSVWSWMIAAASELLNVQQRSGSSGRRSLRAG